VGQRALPVHDVDQESVATTGRALVGRYRLLQASEQRPPVGMLDVGLPVRPADELVPVGTLFGYGLVGDLPDVAVASVRMLANDLDRHALSLLIGVSNVV